jgi:hypothetical protein
MEIPQPPTEPKARRRNHQIMLAGFLSFSVAGFLLVYATESPGDALRWIFLAAWIAVALAGNVYAWRKYYKEHPPEPWPGSKGPPDASRDSESRRTP